MNQGNTSRLWAREAALYIRVSRSTLAKWRMRGEGPPYHRCGRRLVYYLKPEIDRWLADCDRVGRADKRANDGAEPARAP